MTPGPITSSALDVKAILGAEGVGGVGRGAGIADCRAGDGEMEALLVCWLLVGLFVRGFAASLAAFQLKTFLFPCLPHVSLSLSVSLSV